MSQSVSESVGQRASYGHVQRQLLHPTPPSQAKLGVPHTLLALLECHLDAAKERKDRDGEVRECGVWTVGASAATAAAAAAAAADDDHDDDYYYE